MTSLNFKLQNYWSSQDFAFMMYKSSIFSCSCFSFCSCFSLSCLFSSFFGKTSKGIDSPPPSRVYSPAFNWSNCFCRSTRDEICLFALSRALFLSVWSFVVSSAIFLFSIMPSESLWISSYIVCRRLSPSALKTSFGSWGLIWYSPLFPGIWVNKL